MDPELRFFENEKLIHYFIHKHYNYLSSYNTLTYDDYYQLGAIGLWRACLTYNEGLSKFSTYAMFLIKGSIYAFIRDHEDKYQKLNPSSLDIPITECEEEIGTVLSLIEDFSSEVEFDDMLTLLAMKQSLTDSDYQFLLDHSDRTTVEMGKIYGVGQVNASRKRSKLYRELKSKGVFDKYSK